MESNLRTQIAVLPALPNTQHSLFFTVQALSVSTTFAQYPRKHRYIPFSDTFKKLHPLALANQNVRILEINRRGYKPTTLYNQHDDADGELRDLNGKNGVEGYREFWHRRALEVANLLLNLIQVKNLPKINTETKTDGVVLMGWSMGTATLFGFLGQTDAPGIIKKYEALKTHLRGIIMYGTHSYFLTHSYAKSGIDSSLFYHTPTVPPTDQHQFALFVSGYYSHTGSDISSSDVITTLQADPPPSIYNMSNKEQDHDALVLTELPMYHENIRPILVEQRTKSLFEPLTASTILPDIFVVLIGCEKSHLGCVRGRLGVEKEYSECVREGRKGREIKFITIDNVNHFVSPRKLGVTAAVTDGQMEGALG